MYRSIKLIIPALLLMVSQMALAQSAVDIRINEVLPYNATGITDEEGDRVGWIELFNTAYGMVDVAGFYISDDLNYRTKYMIPKGNPDTKIVLRGYLLLYADGEPSKGVFHTNFTLDGVKDLYLFAPDSTLVDQMHIPPLEPDQSFGRRADGEGLHEPYGTSQRSLRKSAIDRAVGTDGGFTILDHPTPGATNSTKTIISKSQKMGQIDPFGLILALTAMSVVFFGLVVLFISFKLIGKKAIKQNQKKEKNESAKELDTKTMATDDEEVVAAIATALQMYYGGAEDSGIHDSESGIITIDKKYIENSPWGSKSFRRVPIKINRNNK